MDQFSIHWQVWFKQQQMNRCMTVNVSWRLDQSQPFTVIKTTAANQVKCTSVYCVYWRDSVEVLFYLFDDGKTFGNTLA